MLRYLGHSVKIDLGTQNLGGELYLWDEWPAPGWRALDCIHLLIRHRVYMDPDSPIKDFDEINIKNYTFPFGEIARDLLKRSKAFDF
jgi:hypothetical protein